jgi:hypothetical protein
MFKYAKISHMNLKRLINKGDREIDDEAIEYILR